MSKILIISLEGIESNTEVNFFQGLNDWLRNSNNIVVKAIGKLSESSNKQKNYEAKIKTILNFDDDFINYEVFFIGDSDTSSDIDSMKRGAQKFKEIWIENGGVEKKLDMEIIYPGNKKGFDQLLEMICPSFISPNKKGIKRITNKRLFNDFAEEAGWTSGDKLDIEKIEEDLKRVKTDYLKIFYLIINK